MVGVAFEQREDAAPSPEVMLKVPRTQIGDIIVIKRTYEDKGEQSTVTIKCEGFMDSRVYPQEAATWLSETELCLFKVEVPMIVMSSAKSNKRLEEKAMKTASQASQGAVVKYGQQVQLRHVHSGGYLAMALTTATKEPGTFAIEVSKVKTNYLNVVTLQPDSKLQKVGEPIRYWDKVEVMFQEGNLKHYLHLRQPKTQQELPAIVGSLQASAWTFSCFEDVSMGDETFKCGSVVQVQLVNSVLHLSQKGEVANLRGDENDYGGFWVAEREVNIVGGPIHFGEVFFLKNARTGLYLSSDLRLSVQPRPTSALYMPKPESFKTQAEVSYNFPVILCLPDGGKLASAVTERKEEIMFEVVPHGSSESREELVLEADLALDMAQGKDVLFQVDLLNPIDANFLMQMAKLVPKFETFHEELKDYLLSRSDTSEFLIQVRLVETALRRASELITQSVDPDTYEHRQSIVVGMGVHKVLIAIAYSVFRAGGAVSPVLQQMVRSIWNFLIEVVSDNEFASAQVERQKEPICDMVATEKQLIGTLLSEVYRIVDPDMPNYMHDFKEWSDKLETLRDDNVLEQTVFVKLIRCLCEVGENVKVEYQRAIVALLFDAEPFPMVRMLKVEDVFYVQFYTKPVGESPALFASLNPTLPVNEELTATERIACVNLEAVMKQPNYVEYLANALLLINTLCKGQFEPGRKIAEQQGLNSELLVSLMQWGALHLKLREACLQLADSLFVSCAPYKSSLQSKKENFCYSSEQLKERQEYFLWNPLETEKPQTSEVRLCLHLTLSIWMQREVPSYFRNYQKLHVLNYIAAALRVAYSLLDFDHCSHLYARCIARGLAFLLLGMRDTKDEVPRKHWGVVLLQAAVKEMHRSMDIRVQLNDIFRVLVQLLMGVMCFTRQNQLAKLASACCKPRFDEMFVERSEELLRLIEQVNDPLEGVESLKRMLDKSVSSSFGSEVDGSERSDLNPSLAFRFSREIVLRGPETKEALFRVMLTWNSISSSLKDTLITLLKQSYDNKAMLSKFLRNVDIISEPSILTQYEDLKTYSQQYNLEQLALECKFEMLTGGSAALSKLCDVMEHVANFVNPRSGQPPYILDKLQNVLRHLSWHKRVMALWPTILYIGRMQKTDAAERDLLRLSTLTVCFLLNFCRNNPRNRAELLALFQTDYYDLKVPQYAELIRQISGFELLTVDIAQRLVTFLLDNVEAAHSSVFLNTLMYTREGNPREDLQNLVARLVSEHLAQRLQPALLQTLALSCVDNSCATVLCRSLKSVEAIQDLAAATKDPLLLESLLEFFYFVHLRTNADLNPPIGDTAAFLTMMQSIQSTLQPVFTDQLDLVASARRGIVEQVYPKANPTLVDEMRGIKDDTRHVYHLFSGENEKGLLGLLPHVLSMLYDRPHLALPVVKDVRTTLSNFAERAKLMQRNNSDLEFTPLLKAIESNISSISSFIERHEMKSDKLAMISFVARKLAKSMKRNKRDEDSSFENYHVDQRLRQFVTLYDSHSDMKEEDYLGELADVFLSMVFKEEIPVKVPREAVDAMVRMLNKMKRVFAGTHHRNLYFQFLQRLVPEVETEVDRRRKYVFNQVFLRSGVIEEAVLAATASNTLAESNAALDYLNTLLDEQSKDFQDQFRDLLDAGEKSYYLFLRFKSELEQVKVRVLEQVAKAQKSTKGMARHLDQALSEGLESRVTEVVDEGVSGKEQFLINSLVFLQLCCDNCNLDFQNYIRSQRKQAGLADIDLVTEVANLVIDLSATGNFVKENKATCQILVKSFAALLDFVTGPCPGNQIVLGNNVPLFLAINTLLSATLFEVTKRANKIHSKICIFLHTLLEGDSDVTVYQTMVRFLDLRLLREGVERFYKEHISGSEESFSLELDTLDSLVLAKLKSTLLQAILLLKLKKFQRQHPELKRFSSRGLDQRDAYNFFIRYIGYVEVDKGGVVQSHYFPIPFKCKFLTAASRESLLQDVNRNSHQKKIEDFMGRVDVCMREMKHQQQLSQHQTLKQVTEKWKLFAQVSFFVVLLTNVQVLLTFSGSLQETMENSPTSIMVIRTMGVLELLLYVASFTFNTLEYFPNKLSVEPLDMGAEIDRYPKFPHNESQYIRLVFEELHAGPKQKESFDTTLRETCSNFGIYYNYVYFLIAIVAVYWPLFSAVLLLDLIKQNQELINVLQSVTVNLRQLLITLCLGVIIIFLFSVYSFVYYQDYYSPDSGLYCHDVLNCFTSTLNMGVRAGGGIGDALLQPDHAGPDYWSRMTFDMLFYLLIIIVLLNIIFGIIIDTFAQLRNQRSFVLEDINTRCYVCGLERSEIELHGKGWSYHFMVEHSPLAYLAFFVYLKEMPIVDCAGIEKYVKEKFEKRDYSFMPATSKLLQTKLQKIDNRD